ncbi:MAG: acyl-CoA dehydrogenase family protein, partial [Acidobacteriota bacterium]
RGAPPPPRDRLAVAAVAVGLGRAALEEALTVLRASGDRPGGGVEERPHWVLADAATELDAARLLVHQAAAEAVDEARAALAQVFAAGAAMRAVDAAVRVIGAAAYRAGSTLERLARDARATQLLLGTEDQGRAIAAAGLLPG